VATIQRSSVPTPERVLAGSTCHCARYAGTEFREPIREYDGLDSMEGAPSYHASPVVDGVFMGLAGKPRYRMRTSSPGKRPIVKRRRNLQAEIGHNLPLTDACAVTEKNEAQPSCGRTSRWVRMARVLHASRTWCEPLKIYVLRLGAGAEC